MQGSGQIRRVSKGRLIWYRSDVGEQFWENQWERHFSLRFYDPYKQGQLGMYKALFCRFLPKTGRILEAGCGLGQYVVALEERGYTVDGVDLALESLKKVGTVNPEVRLYAGAVERLPVADGCYAGYISLGVVEHRESGPEVYLREAARVLQDDGIAIFTVPHFNNLRRLVSSTKTSAASVPGVMFYQYGFTREEFTSLLEDAGFRIIFRGGLDVLKGLRDEFPRFKSWFDRRPQSSFRSNLGRVLERIPVLKSHIGHMLVIVAKKTL